MPTTKIREALKTKEKAELRWQAVEQNYNAAVAELRGNKDYSADYKQKRQKELFDAFARDHRAAVLDGFWKTSEETRRVINEETRRLGSEFKASIDQQRRQNERDLYEGKIAALTLPEIEALHQKVQATGDATERQALRDAVIRTLPNKVKGIPARSEQLRVNGFLRRIEEEDSLDKPQALLDALALNAQSEQQRAFDQKQIIDSGKKIKPEGFLVHPLYAEDVGIPNPSRVVWDKTAEPHAVEGAPL